MAGTGFELKKIYKKENVIKSALGIAYSTLVTIGPTVLIIFAILILYFFLGTSNMDYKQRELLSSTVLFSFIFSVLLTSLYNVLLSKFVTESASSKSGIADSFYMGLAICGAIASVAFLPMGWELALGKNMDINFVIAAYIQWVSLVAMFFSLTYLNVAKDYKVITSIFILGTVLTFMLGIVCQSFFGSDLMHAMIYGLAAGFFFIATLSFAYVKRYFKMGNAFGEGLKYAWSFKKLMFANFFYILGLYIHNMVFWATPGRLFVSSNYYSYQPYDMASCLAMFTNISMLIGFIYMVENRFHKSYTECMEGVAGGTYRMIEKSKKKMFRSISQQISQVLGVQAIISSVLFLFITLFGIRVGFDNNTITIYPLLVISFFGIFAMYGNMIYLYYFADTMGALITSVLFCALTFGGTFISRMLPMAFWGFGSIIGMIAGWIFSSLRIKWIEKNVDYSIFCDYKLVDTMKSSNKGKTIYKKANGK